MTSNQTEKEFALYVGEMMQPIGPVQRKFMFGVYGLFLDGLMIGLITDNTLYLKTNKNTEHLFKNKGLEPFTYQKKNKAVSLPYFQAPEEILEEHDAMNERANRSYSKALHARTKK